MGMADRGFTIIEVMLFLGITGMLFAGLMIGVNSNVTQQRYRDGVAEFSSLLKNQYSEVLNTQNARTEGECIDGTVNPSASTAQTAGTSNCVLLGRAVQVENNGTSVKISNVVGFDSSTGNPSANIESYTLKITTIDEETEELDWGTTLYTTDGGLSEASVLILRLPVSGLMKVYWSKDTIPSNIDFFNDPVIDIQTESPLKYCVRSDTVSLPVQSVSVDPTVAGASGIAIMDADPDCVHGGL